VFFAPYLEGEPVGGRGQAVHLHATDAEGEWLVRLLPAGVEVGRGHAKGDAAARGPASDLLLFLWGRAPADRLEQAGDPALLPRVRELAAMATQ
jgi:predicted lipid carrier protein YhbT